MSTISIVTTVIWYPLLTAAERLLSLGSAPGKLVAHYLNEFVDSMMTTMMMKMGYGHLPEISYSSEGHGRRLHVVVMPSTAIFLGVQ